MPLFNPIQPRKSSLTHPCLETLHLHQRQTQELLPTLLLLFSRSVVSDSLQPHGLQHARLPCPSLSPRVCSNSCPLSQRSHLNLLPPSPPTLNISQHQGLFQWVSSSQQVVKVLELQHQSFQWIFRVDFLKDWLVGSFLNPLSHTHRKIPRTEEPGRLHTVHGVTKELDMI